MAPIQHSVLSTAHPGSCPHPHVTPDIPGPRGRPTSPVVPCSFLAPINFSSPELDKIIERQQKESENKLSSAMTLSSLSTESKRTCSSLLRNLRIHKALFLYTYEHLVVCCKSRIRLQQLDEVATKWGKWTSVQQLARHAIIRERLLSYGSGCTCQHKSVFDRHSPINNDKIDLLTLVLCCSKKPELYKLVGNAAIQESPSVAYKESEEIVELLWKFLLEREERNLISRCLCASIYRMTRKSGYLPRDIRIDHSLITREWNFPKALQGAFVPIKMGRMNSKDVVIKRIHFNGRPQKECLEMFCSEAILWRTLQHKNIVPFMGVIIEDSNLGLVSPFFAKGSIRTYMLTCNLHEWPALAKRWARDLASALNFIHNYDPPIIHGDIKGDNALVGDDGHACLADFGQSYSSDSAVFLDSMRVGRVCCPFRWMAPENLTDRNLKATAKSDVYAFGCVVYEMISGQIPFQRLTCGEDVKACVLQNQRPNRPDSVCKDDALWKLIEACWAQKPEDRPSAKKLAAF